VQTKAILYQNLWNFALLSAILFWVCIALKKFTQVLSYVICTQVRRHVHKEITKTRDEEEDPGRFVFGKPVLFILGLGLTTPYSLGILVWNFYQKFFTVSVEFWLRFEPYIRPTRLELYFLFITSRAERKVHLCAKLFDFFSWVNTHSFDLKFVAFCHKFSVGFLVEFQEKLFREDFSQILYKPRLSYTKTCEISPTFCNFVPGSYCAEKIHASTFICCLHPGKEARP